MCLQEYHRDSVTCLLPILRAECSSTGFCIATRSQLRSQAGFCSALLTLYFRLRLPGVIVWGRRGLVPGRVVWRESSCKTFITGGVPAFHAGAQSEDFSMPPRDFFATNQVLPFVRPSLCVPV